MRRALLLLMLAGCASPGAHAPDDFNAASKEPGCARECLAGYNTCTGGIRQTNNRLITGDVLTACQANTRQCLSTCPTR